jgi:hypothetical protein
MEIKFTQNGPGGIWCADGERNHDLRLCDRAMRRELNIGHARKIIAVIRKTKPQHIDAHEVFTLVGTARRVKGLHAHWGWYDATASRLGALYEQGYRYVHFEFAEG